MKIELIKGPFQHLWGNWQFEALSDGACRVSLQLHYEFSSALSSLLFSKVFTQVANKMVAAFCARAVVVYGER